MLGDAVTGPACFEFCLFDGITLEQCIQVPLFAPAAGVVVVGEFASGKVADDRVPPL